MNLRSISPWVWVTLAVLVLVLVAVVVVLLVRRRRRKAAAASAVAEPSMARVYRDFLARLPESVRGDPAVIVLGERHAGKTAFVQAAIDPVGRAGLFLPSETGDRRLQLFAGERRIVQEVGADVLASLQPETRAELLDLWRPVALRAPVVVLVVRAGGPSFTPTGLRELGTLARGKVDCLTELRGRPVRVRVCVTHLDREAPGFVELTSALDEAAGSEARRGVKVDPASGVAELAALLPLGLRSGPAEAFGAMTDFAGTRGPSLMASLKPLLQALLDARGPLPPPLLDGILLAALPEGAPQVLTGDPLAVEAKEVEAEQRALTRRQRRLAIEVFAAAAALSVLPYLHHATIHLGGAKRDVAALDAAVRRYSPEGPFPPAPDVDAVAKDAGLAVAELLDPFWPLLKYTLPRATDDVHERYLRLVREAYLTPVLRRPSRLDRVYAAAVFYAEREDRAGDPDALGAKILADPGPWAARLGIPAEVVRDYVTVNDARTAELPRDLGPLPPAPEAGIADWIAFLDRMQSASAASKLDGEALARLKEDAAGLGAALDEATAAQGVTEVITLLEERHGPEIVRLIGIRAPSREVPPWVLANREDLAQVLDVARGSSLKIPSAAGKSLQKALVDIEAIKPASPPKPSYAFQPPEGPALTVDAASFAAAVAGLRASAYAIMFMDDARGRQWPAFFAANAFYSSVGGAAAPGRGATLMVPGVYTKEAFDRDVGPAVSGLDDRLAKTSLPVDDQRALASFVDGEMRRYASGMRDVLRAYYASFRFSPPSVSALRADVNDMLAPSSWFSDFLLTVAKSAGVGPLDDPHFQPLAEAVADMQPIVALMAQDKGKFPALEKYTAVLATMLPSLDPGAPGASPPPGTPLPDRLSPIGKLGFSMLTKDKASPLEQVVAFLDSAAIPAGMRKPFLLPVELAYRFGISDVEQEVAKAYTKEVLPAVRPLLEKFPFDVGADRDASGEDVTAALGAKGAFWKAFEAGVAPVCDGGQDGVYTPKSSPLGSARVPAGALPLARWAGQLGKVLWDADGKPKPLSLSAKPMLLPAMAPEETVTLSFLRVGSASVYGFNQSPAFHALPAAWSPGEPASVGMEVTTTGGGDKQFASIDADGSDFAILRLLKKGRTGQAGVWTWVLSAGGAGSRKYAISFEVAGDPFALFRPPARAR